MTLNTYASGGIAASSRNRVLRNTYALLALSMLPTILGAFIGVQLGFSFFAGSPMLGFMLFMAVAFGFFFAIEKFKNSSVGVLLLLGFTFFMGLMLSRSLQYTLGFSNGASLIALAAGGTGVIFFAMAGLATVTKRDLSGMGKFLFVGMIVALIAGVANIFLQLPALSIVMAVACLGIFSAYILYDVNRVVTGGETNYVTATLAIYLDIYNVFVSLLQLLGIFGGDRD
ncbi:MULTISPECIES: Bax inhibitor-1/YccA family protein [Niveibacterium]|uniref:Bax inhibitor-1/YccA family protein n=1 Tax=Niveibacterium microcysteis TaxID=2811415 RepID=A0ABX7MA50_9RHOO|nr:Bax inhibitor-1/YccA family protein [Niveibacterium microcysteis]QSI78593.1 Bax inhibitor-1/YccA family protein [Niveibacterium microcysteis]